MSRTLQLLAPTADQAAGVPENERMAIERWMRGNSENTRRTYTTALRTFLRAAGTENVSDACQTPEQAKRAIAAFCDAMAGKCAATRHQRLSHFRRLLVLCAEEGATCSCAKYVPVEDHKPEPQMRPWFPDDAQLSKMIRLENDPQKKLLLQVLYRMGLRASEALSLRLENVFYTRSTDVWAVWVLGKGSRGRDVPIPGDMVSEIMGLQLENDGRGYWFRRGYSWAYRSSKAALRRIGVDEKGKACHALRHSHGQNAQDAGESESAVSRNMGHASLEMLRQRYGRHVPKSPGENLGRG